MIQPLIYFRVSETSSLLYLSDVMDTWALLGSRHSLLNIVSTYLTFYPNLITPFENHGLSCLTLAIKTF